MKYNFIYNKYECGEPEKPLNSLPIETHKNNVVQYQCKDGYLLEGPAERHCQNDGFWSKGQAVCKEVTCKELEAPLNSRMVLSGLNENRQATILSQAYFHCDSGFQVVGENRLVCLSTGKWSSSTPQCIAIDCGLPKNIVPELSRFILLNGTTRFGSMALLECLNDQGLPETEVTIVCQQDGLWSQAYISCNKQDWLSSETFVKSQLDLVKSGNGNVITSMIIIILCALSMIIILLIALLLKRKFLSVKLVTWRDHDHSDGKRCKALRSKHKRLGATLCTVRKHLGLQSDLPLFGSLKCSFPSLPMATSSEANVVTQSGLTVNSSSQGYGNYNVTDDAGKLINVNKYLDKHDSSKHDCSDGSICVPIEDSYRSSYRNYQNLDEIETNETSIQTGLPSSTPTTTRVTSTVEVTASTVACLDEHALVSTEKRIASRGKI
uniref:Sushi domain-containing protein n=1 Tax=Tetranychus urticae TaxID=32264 RepID=T1L2W4_TETUR